MCSGEGLGIDIFVSVSLTSIELTVKFLPILREIFFSKNYQNFSFSTKFKSVLIRHTIEHCLKESLTNQTYCSFFMYSAEGCHTQSLLPFSIELKFSLQIL